MKPTLALIASALRDPGKCGYIFAVHQQTVLRAAPGESFVPFGPTDLTRVRLKIGGLYYAVGDADKEDIADLVELVASQRQAQPGDAA